MGYRVLILQSARGDTSRRREIHLANSPLLREHIFDHLYVMDTMPLDETLPIPARAMQVQDSLLDEQALLARLAERVQSFRPDILLVNSGSAFLTFPEQMFFVLQTLKATYPELRIGFQPKPFERMAPQPFFEYTPEMDELLKKVF